LGLSLIFSLPTSSRARTCRCAAIKRLMMGTTGSCADATQKTIS
jgi:hypothetical protein